MLRSNNIHIVTNCDFFEFRESISESSLVVYTGPIDRYFDYSEGRLGWRTLDFEREVVNMPDYQGAAVVNYPDLAYAFTRIHEFRHLHPERRHHENATVIFREYSRFADGDDEPFYPISTMEDKRKYQAYAAKARNEVGVLFGGRLGGYQYIDMHQAIGGALSVFEKKIYPRFGKRLEQRRDDGNIAEGISL